MNSRMKRLKKQLERRGGWVMISDDLPDDVAEIFAREIEDCPDCAAVLKGLPKPDNRGRHEH